jgi:hypothetical protein
MHRKAPLFALSLLLAACSADEITQVKGAMTPEAGFYRYTATTRNGVLLTGAMVITYSGTDSIAGEILAADPQGKPYLDGHFVTPRAKDGSYVFQLPKSQLEPTESSYVNRLYRTRSGYTCEFRDVLRGNTVTKSCEATPP